MNYFLIIGTLNVVTYKDVIPSVKRGEVWFGHNKKNFVFNVPDDYPLEGSSCGIDEKGRKWIELGNVRWLTNIGKNNRKPLTLTEHYSPEKYPRYDNYEAIEVGKVKKIPCDYYGEMGVPVSFLGKYCPEQFEIIGITSSARWNGKNKYARVMIKKRG